MFYCERCRNTGKIVERYAEMPPPVFPLTGTIPDQDVEIKVRTVECPACLGFGAVGWAL